MKIFFSILIVLLIFTGFVITNKQPKYDPSKAEKLVNSVLDETAKIIQKKYNIKTCGTGASMPGGPIQGLTLCFETRYPYTKEDLRLLVIKSAEELIRQVNENHDIQEFLKERPFNIKNVQIIIYNHDINGRSLKDPDISNVQILQGLLTYSTIDPADSFRYKNEFEESYEEGLKALIPYRGIP